MQDKIEQQSVSRKDLSRRDFLKICSATLGVLLIPNNYTNIIDQSLTLNQFESSTPEVYFQWQNEFICKTVYQMREVKLRDFLTHYQEVDVWSNYKGKELSALSEDVYAYKKSWETKATKAYQEYKSLLKYFMTESVRSNYSKFLPIDELEMTNIDNLHVTIIQSWPHDIRNERLTVEEFVKRWEMHRDEILDWIQTRERRHQSMDPAHPKYAEEGKELEQEKNITLPMAEQELSHLRDFLRTYDKIEERKREWFDLSTTDQNFKTPEEEFLTKFPPKQEVTVQDLAHWSVEEYKISLVGKNQFELLDFIKQRFDRNPQRYPLWLQYMVVHFSGMR
ncbi:MAG: hypothetical protein JNK81_11145 [Anaerolineales bacterium]|nr:hypothetical protein [Anaerolineales bacterium]